MKQWIELVLMVVFIVFLATYYARLADQAVDTWAQQNFTGVRGW